MSKDYYFPISVFSSMELSLISKIICDQVRRVTQIPLERIENYHLSHSRSHHLMAPKSARQFPESDVHTFLSLPSIKTLRAKFSDFDIGYVMDERGMQERSEVYFRLVRPNSPTDVGMPHCDHWFHTKAGLPHSIGTTYKLWIAVCAEPGLSGLCFFPESKVEQLGALFFEGIRDSSKYSSLLGTPVFPEVSPGDALLFLDDVVHGGALNRGTKTRCSIEITLVPRDK